MEPDNLIYSFSSKRQGLLVMCILARTADTGGKRCFVLDEHVTPWLKKTDTGTIEKADTFYHLRFLPDAWQKVMNPHADPNSRPPPSVREMSWFVRGYLRALTGVKPTVL